MKVGVFNTAWLAPAAALLVLLCMLHNPRVGASWSEAAAAQPMVGVIMSNQNLVSYLTDNFKADHNRLGETFEWTNQGGFTSSISSLSTVKVKQSQ